MNVPFNFWATHALTDQPLRAFIGCRNDRQLPRRILWGVEQPPVPAGNSVDFGAAISTFPFADLQTIARDPSENSIEFGAAMSDFRC